MAWRTSTTPGRSPVHIEPARPDEVQDPVADDRPDVSGVARRQNGTVATSEAAAVLGGRGGRVKAKRVWHLLLRCQLSSNARVTMRLALSSSFVASSSSLNERMALGHCFAVNTGLLCFVRSYSAT